MNAGPHLDDDVLSARLDGLDVGEGADAHLAGCAECRARFGALGAAAAAVRAPVAMPDSVLVDRAVAQALDAEGRSGRLRVMVALAAAVLVAVGIAGTVFVGDESRPSDSDTAALSDGENLTGGNSAGGAAGGAVVAFGGDLGEVDDPKELSDRVRTVVEPVPTTTADEGGAAVEAGPPAALRATSDRNADPYCERAVAKEYDEGLGQLVYRATLRWNGTPAVALAYAVAEARGELDHRLYVLSSSGCELLVAQTF